MSRKKWSPSQKFEIALLAIKGETTLNEICTRYEIAPSLVHAWKKQLVEHGSQLFEKSDKTASEAANKLEREQGKLYEKIGQLTVERDFLKKAWGQIPREQRRELIEAAPAELSMRRCCELLEINRSTLYYKEKPAGIDDIDLLNIIRDIWERYPFYGYRRITKELRANKQINVNRKRVQRLMTWGGIQAIHPGPNTSKRNRLHAVHKYLLKDVEIMRPNQAWMIDITYLRMPKGFMYLVAIIDVYSRYVVGWSLSNTLETDSCIDALKSGLAYAVPEIINSDQGCQFTSDDWIHFLREWDIKISMTGKGRCIDNIYIERFWRSFKREEFYLNEYESVNGLRKAIGTYIDFYNRRRWHQSLGYKTCFGLF